MKNKKLTYFLGLVVLGVWGLIIYRIFNAASASDDNNIRELSPNITKEPYNDFSLPKDTTHLLMNYRDPFGLVKSKDTTRIVARKSTNKTPTQIKPMDWGFIKYSGYILNPGSKKMIALVSINGQYTTLYEGQTKYQVKLIKNLRDSIKVSFNNKTKFISIK